MARRPSIFTVLATTSSMPVYLPADALSWSRILTSSKGTTLVEKTSNEQRPSSRGTGRNAHKAFGGASRRARQNTEALGHFLLAESCAGRRASAYGAPPGRRKKTGVPFRKTFPHSSLAANLVARFGASIRMGAAIPRYSLEKLTVKLSVCRESCAGDGLGCVGLPFVLDDFLEAVDHAIVRVGAAAFPGLELAAGHQCPDTHSWTETPADAMHSHPRF